MYNLYGTGRSLLSNPSTYLKSAAMPAGIGAALAALAPGATAATVGAGALSAVGLGSLAAPLGLTGATTGLSAMSGTVMSGMGLGGGSAVGGIGGALGSIGGAFGSAGSAIMGGLIAMGPAGWLAIGGGLALTFAITYFMGRDLEKAKGNWETNTGTIKGKLKSQDPTMPEGWADAISSQQSFESLSTKDRKNLLKTAKEKVKKAVKKLAKQGIYVTAEQLMQSPQRLQLLAQAGVKDDDALMIVAKSGYNPLSFDGKNPDTATKVVDFAAEYYKATGKVVGDFNISKEFVSKAGTLEKDLAAKQFDLMSNGDGKLTRAEVKAYYDKNFANMTPDQLDAELKKRGFAINIDELKDDAKNVTATTFENYIFEATDQKTEFKSDKNTGSITATSDGSVSKEEFADLFIQPKASDLEKSDMQDEVAGMLAKFHKEQPSVYANILNQINASRSAPSSAFAQPSFLTSFKVPGQVSQIVKQATTPEEILNQGLNQGHNGAIRYGVSGISALKNRDA